MGKQATWSSLVSNLGTWKRGSERAVHKPLLTLMLLARAQQGGTNHVQYSEVAEALRRALREFGPPRKTLASSGSSAIH